MGWLKVIFRIINVLIYLVLVATWIAIPQETTLNLAVTVFNLAFTAILIIQAREQLARYYTSGWFKNFITYTLGAFLLLGILGVGNYLAFKNPRQIDVSKTQTNSVTDKSKSIVKSVKGIVRINVFSKKSFHASIRALLDLYRFEKNDLEIIYNDVDLRPDLVKKYAVTRVPSMVLEYGDKREFVTGFDELSITNSFIKLSRDEDPVIYYSTGHEEVDLDSKENEGAVRLRRLIRRSSYSIRKVNLNNVSEIPSFVKTLVVWGPRSGFFEREISVIDKFLEKGGKLMVALDPSAKDDKVALFRTYLQKWGISILNNYVVDRLNNVNGSNGSVPIVHSFNKDHPITRELSPPVFFPLTSSVASTNEDQTVEILATSTPFPASWAENTPSELLTGKLTYAETTDFKGPVGYMGVWQKKGKDTRIVAFGNSSFVINTYAKFPRNFMLFLNSLSWLVDDDQLLSFNNPVIKDQPIFVNSTQLGVIFYFSVLFTPLLMFSFAIFLYRRRLKL